MVEVEENEAKEHICDSASQSARPGTYGNPKQRPEGGPIEKNNGKTGYTLRLAKVLTKPTQRGNNGDNGTYMMKE